MPRVRFSNDAKGDLKAIGLYIAQFNVPAAIRSVSKIRRKCRMLGKHPGLGERCESLPAGSRRTLVGNYVIYYRVEGNTVVVSRIVRAERDLDSI